MQEKQILGTNIVPLTTLQAWFLERQTWINPHHWNITFLLELGLQLERATFYQTIRYLFRHHEGLRLRFRQENSQWQAFIDEPDDNVPVLWIDLSTLSEIEQKKIIEATSEQLQKSLNIQEGKLIQIAYFNLGLQRMGRLLWISHHLIVDAFSCQIILQDFEVVYRQFQDKQNIQPFPKTTSLQQWGRRLEKHVASSEMRQEFENHWLRLPWDEAIPLPVDYPESQDKTTNASLKKLAASLSMAETKALYSQVYHLQTEIMPVLLMALVEAFKYFQNLKILYVDVVDHGRITPFEDINLLRTVGQIAIGRRYLLRMDRSLSVIDTLNGVQEQLKNTPNHGVGYDWLTYLSKDQEIAAKMQELPLHQILFNYLGRQTTQANTTTPSLFRLAQEAVGPTEDPREQAEAALRYTASTVNNEFTIECQYSDMVYKHTTIEKILQKYVNALKLFIAAQAK